MAGISTYSDQELIAFLRQGDSAAFTAIFERYQSLLYIFAYKRINDREEAKDMIHELFASIWERRESIQISGDILPYLYTALKNRIFDLYKHKQVTRRYLESFQEYLDTAQNAADYRVRHNDLSALIEKEIAALPEKMRVVFELSRKSNLSRKEIAEVLGMSEETVKSRMHSALKILKGRLGSLLVIVFLMS